jgi:hypothetical protein
MSLRDRALLVSSIQATPLGLILHWSKLEGKFDSLKAAGIERALNKLTPLHAFGRPPFCVLISSFLTSSLCLPEDRHGDV